MISTQAYEHELDQRNVLTLCFLMVTVLLQVFPPNSLIATRVLLVRIQKRVGLNQEYPQCLQS